MKPFVANFLNACLLIIIGIWAYFSSENPSVTALIPVFTGLILIVLTLGIKKGNKIIAHLAVILTFLVLVGLIKPLTGVIDRNDSIGILRVVTMMISSLWALLIFIKSFINARKISNKS